MQKTPKGFRLHIGLFGRRNVGKSSLLNALTQQSVSIVSETAGTTTDPVEKPMELLPIGPVLFIDTAGIDDEGALGELRVQKTREVFDRTEIGIVVSTEAQDGGAFTNYERNVVAELKKRDVPVIFVVNKIDLAPPTAETETELREQKIPFVAVNARQGTGLHELREALVRTVPEDFLTPPPILSDLLPPGEMAVLVVPIDKEAPKGRLILPQVQAIRDVLDAHQSCVVVQDVQLKNVLSRIQPPPALVVTDSQAFAKVSADVPASIPLTSFSILFARQKGDLSAMVDGARAIERLRPGDRLVIAEACTHHPIGEDIGTVKIPQFLRQYMSNRGFDGELDIRHVRGHDFSDELLTETKLVIHCGACMWNRREMLSRLLRCHDAGVPMTNYGLAIAFMLGIFDRALKPFRPSSKENDSRKDAKTQRF